MNGVSFIKKKKNNNNIINNDNNNLWMALELGLKKTNKVMNVKKIMYFSPRKEM